MNVHILFMFRIFDAVDSAKNASFSRIKNQNWYGDLLYKLVN